MSQPTKKPPPSNRPRLATALSVAITVAAMLVIHGALALYRWLPDPTLATAVAPIVEALAIFAVLLVVAFWPEIAGARLWQSPRVRALLDRAWARRIAHGARWLGRRAGHRTLLGILTAAVFVFFVLGVGGGFAQREFGYPLVIALHIHYVPELFKMMAHQEPLWAFILYCALLVVIVASVIAGSYLALRRIHRFTRQSRRRRFGVLVALVAYIAVIAPFAGFRTGLVADAADQVDFALHLEERLDTTARKMEIASAKLQRQSPFDDLSSPPSILLIVVESYGEVLFSDPEFRAYPPTLRRLGDELSAAGYHMRSRYLKSPTFGGSSWMAGASLLCGIKIQDQKRYASLFRSGVRCLSAMLHDAGYHTVYAAPNTTHIDAPFRSLFDYDAHYIHGSIRYAGPRFAWSYMPDQYLLDYIDKYEVSRAKGPFVVVYRLTSSHHAWRNIPYYLEDWNQLGDGAIYRHMRSRHFNNRFVTGSEYKPAYITSIDYVMKTVAGYLERLPADDKTLIIVLGDHQPRHPVAEMNENSWAVPVHILSRDPTAVSRFAKLGYEPGLIPVTPPSAKTPGFSAFIPELFSAYSTDDD